MGRLSPVGTLVRVAAASAPLVALAGCGGPSSVPADQRYTGPLHVAASDAVHPTAGAAGDVVSCTHWGTGGASTEAVYSEGATADSPEAALETARHEGGFDGIQEGLRIAAETADRVLYVFDVGGVVKQAVIVHDGPASEGAGGPGWYVESWAHCDYSEFPREFTDSLGLQVWTGPDGTPASTRRIQSWVGPEHCDWEAMTFLEVGGTTYVRKAEPDLSEFFVGPYEAHGELPADAVDTGFQRDGDHLWLAQDGRYAYVGTAADVESWPSTVRMLGCA